MPHLDWPIRVQGTGYQTCQQDTTAEAAANIAVLFSFQRGTRAEQPDFGITDPTFQQQPVDTSELDRQAGIYEPRAHLNITQTAEPGGTSTVNVRVHIATAED